MTKVPELDEGWRKSSFSSPDGDCVEVVRTLRAIRDSKAPVAGAIAGDVRVLVSMVRSGRLG